MRINQISRGSWIVIFGTVVLVSALLWPAPVAVFDGHFALTVSVAQHEQLAADNLFYKDCWTGDEVEFVTQNADSEESGFRPLEIDREGVATLMAPVSGRLDYWGRVATYNHPQFLVVKHQRGRNDATVQVFTIPDGRGPRSMKIKLR